MGPDRPAPTTFQAVSDAALRIETVLCTTCTPGTWLATDSTLRAVAGSGAMPLRSTVPWWAITCTSAPLVPGSDPIALVTDRAISLSVVSLRSTCNTPGTDITTRANRSASD